MAAMLLHFCITFAQDFTINIQHDGKQRSFLLHSPCGSYDCTGKKIPLVFAFHGLTESGSAIRNYSQFNAIADTAGFAVIYANGLNNNWNVGFTGSIAGGEDDLGFANAMIDYMIANASDCTNNICGEIDTMRIYSCGMSNGGFFSYLLACRLSHRIAAIASVTGSMTPATFDTCAPVRPVPVFQLHGTTDPIVPYNGGGQGNSKSVDDILAYWVGQNTCNTTPAVTALPDVSTNDGCTVESITYNGCSNGTEVWHYKILNGGHTWPDMLNPYPEIIVGKTNRDINASKEIWRFFSRHRLDGPVSIGETPLAEKVVLYPNPASEQLMAEAPIGTQLQIVDMQGRVLLQQTTAQEKQSITVQSLSSGMYTVLMQHGGQVVPFRFVKQ